MIADRANSPVVSDAIVLESPLGIGVSGGDNTKGQDQNLLGDGVVYALVVFEKDAAQRCDPRIIFCGFGLENLERTGR